MVQSTHKHNMTEQQIQDLCDCKKFCCDLPHTIADLTKEFSMPDVSTVCPDCGKAINSYIGAELKPYCVDCEDKNEKPSCPKCTTNNQVNTYTYKGTVEGWCNRCYVSFDIATNSILYEEEEQVEEQKQLAKHQMTFDGQLYNCDKCSFETAFISEVTTHEAGPEVDPIDEKPKNLHFVEKDSKTQLYKCRYCPSTFADWDTAFKHETPEGRAVHLPASSNSKGTSTTYTNYVHCVHKPSHIIDGKDWGVWAGRKLDCDDKTILNQFDIILNLSGSRLSNAGRHDIPIKELKKWESTGSTYREILLDWPDRGVVSFGLSHPKQWWIDLTNYLKKNKYKMLVFCVGGHGRTGTAVASLMVFALGWEPKQATEWIWENYCDEAIETETQINYVYNLVGQKYVATPKVNAPTETKLLPQSTSTVDTADAWNWD